MADKPEGYTFGPVVTKELRKRVRYAEGKAQWVAVSQARKRASTTFTTYNWFLGCVVWVLDQIERVYKIDVEKARREVFAVRRLMAAEYLDRITPDRHDAQYEEQHPRRTPRHALRRRER